MSRHGFWSLCFALLLILISTPVLAYGNPTDEAIDVVVATPPAGILPVPDYSGDFWNRSNLTGDWGGTRQEWANQGLTFNLRWLQVVQSIVDGGLDQRTAYNTNLDLYINLDLQRMGLIPGAVISFRGQSRFGSTVNADAGVLLPVNTYGYFPLTREMDENVNFAITELNWLQFLSENFAVMVGKITTLGSTNEFAGGEGRSQFMNFQFIYSSVVGQIGPYSALAASLIWMPSPGVTWSTTLMNYQDSSTTTGFNDFGDGATWAVGVDLVGEAFGLPGGMNLSGALGFNGDFARIGGVNMGPDFSVISIDEKKTTWAFFWNGWQYLHTEEGSLADVDGGNGEQDLQGLGMFAILGVADRTTNPVSFSVSGGLSWRGLFPGRDDDTCAIGYFYNVLRDPDTLLGNELGESTQGMEVYYNFAIGEAAQLSLDFQWMGSALPDVDNSIILGLRLNIDF